MSVTYSATSKDEIADFLMTLASDQRASLRWLRKAGDKRDAVLRAATYEDAANIIRQTTIAPAATSPATPET